MSRAYVDAATAVDRSVNGVDRYGYQWWIDVDTTSYFANGDHCQLIDVQPATDLVIVRLGSSCGDTDWPDTLGRLAGWIATGQS